MMQVVSLTELWLLSEKDMSARFESFSPTLNLLSGKNETGKSRVIKHLVWALGCEPPKRNAGGFDSNVIAAVKASVGEKNYTFVRQNRNRAAFDENGNLLLATAKASRWNDFFASTFDYPLKLKRHDDAGFGYAGPDYALLPFYIDQEGGWFLKWGSFTTLGQFLGWQKPVFDSFTGLKSLKLVAAQISLEEAKFKFREAQIHTKLQETSYARIVEVLPKNKVLLSEGEFDLQLRNIASQVEVLSQQQEELRRDLVDLTLNREQKYAEIKMARRTESDLVSDLSYLADIPDDKNISCPTCGQVHQVSFNARLQLSGDVRDVHELVVKLQYDVKNMAYKEVELQAKLKSVNHNLQELNSQINIESDSGSMADVIIAKGHELLKNAYDANRCDLVSQLEILSVEKDGLSNELLTLTDKARDKMVKGFYKEKFISFSDRLGINQAERGSKFAIGSRPPAATGSSGPRAVLAMHMALLSTHLEYGYTPLFPFIVDTPQQSGQDPDSLSKMLTIALIGNGHCNGQVILATESIPTGWELPEGCKVINFESKRRVLSSSYYAEGVNVLAPLVKAMNEAILLEKSELAGLVDEVGLVEGENN